MGESLCDLCLRLQVQHSTVPGATEQARQPDETSPPSLMRESLCDPRLRLQMQHNTGASLQQPGLLQFLFVGPEDTQHTDCSGPWGAHIAGNVPDFV